MKPKAGPDSLSPHAMAFAIVVVVVAAVAALVVCIPSPPERTMPVKPRDKIPEPGTQDFDRMAKEIAEAAEDLGGRKIEGARRMLAVYDRPADNPEGFVVREYLVSGNPPKVYRGGVVARTDTIEAARRHVPEGYANLGRSPDNDPALAEVWLAPK